MGNHVENESFDEFGHEISLVKGVQIMRSGGTPPGQSGGHLQPEESASHHFACTETYLFPIIF